MSNTSLLADKPTSGFSAGLAVAVLLLTLIAAGGGWLIGGFAGTGSSSGAEAVLTAGDKQDKPKPGLFESRTIGAIFELKPIITNLTTPNTVWVRLEAALVARPGEVVGPDIIAQINDDFLTFLRSTNLMQLRGASGLAYLRADLEERARLRSEGRIERVFISSLVME